MIFRFFSFRRRAAMVPALAGILAGSPVRSATGDGSHYWEGNFLVKSARKFVRASDGAPSGHGGWSVKPLGGSFRGEGLDAGGWNVVTPPGLGGSGDHARHEGGAGRGPQLKRAGGISRGAGWDEAYKSVLRSPGDPGSMLRALGTTPEMVEPNFSSLVSGREQKHSEHVVSPEGGDRGTPGGSDAKSGALKINKGFNPAWPAGAGMAWAQGDGYSQIAAARRAVDQKLGGMYPRYPVRIAHLDTGYDPRHSTKPVYFDDFEEKKSIGFNTDGEDLPGEPGRGVADPVHDFMASHGTGTLSILAGRGRLPDCPSPQDRERGYVGYEGWIGTAPGAPVFEVKINSTVVHFATASMARGIQYATEHRADVISISHGGIPSEVWADAVNHAYEHGTVVFAAASDFFALPVLGIALTPYHTVYPAAFSRVMSVPGATKADRSYGMRGSPAALLPWNWGKSMLRGSYGPGGTCGPMPHSLTAYSPNIPWAVLSVSKKGICGDPTLVDCDGGGTSSSTPQVAGAAALYLAYHHENLAAKPRDWRRAETVYAALTRSASAKGQVPWYVAGRSSLFFGTGILQACDALNRAPGDLEPGLTKRPKSEAGLRWLTILLSWFTNVPSMKESDSNGKPAALLQRMTELEAAQLVATDRSLWEKVIALGLAPEVDSKLETHLNKSEGRQLLNRLADHPQISGYLKEKIRSALRTSR